MFMSNNRNEMSKLELTKLFNHKIEFYKNSKNLINIKIKNSEINQFRTNSAFTEKWSVYKKKINVEQTRINQNFQKKWFYDLYGYKKKSLEKTIKKSRIILDAGCGMGEKSAWFASISKDSIVIGVDSSDSIYSAAKKYEDKHDNLFFFRGDISNLPIKKNKIDFLLCDQVIMHTSDPSKTLRHLSSLTKLHYGEFCCYWYAKKALPRELLDDYFREYSKTLTHKELWELSKGLTLLGKNLSKLNIKVEIPALPALGIKKQKTDIQRFIYWNFLKCFWNNDLGKDTSILTNFDWYSPVNAKRFSEDEVLFELKKNRLSINHFHSEPACYAGRFKRV